jgi:L-cystine uptake protein TcyP (sodium:dicarboxylate symporter family)
MQAQNYKNHTRFVPVYHFVLLLVVLAIIVISIINLVTVIHRGGRLLQASLLVLMAIAITITAGVVRTFSVGVQDRSIRAEENLRHFVLTGKLLDSRLTLRQIIALRFAPDQEFVDLAGRAVKENLSNTMIKKAIQNWRADHHRV